MGKKVTAVSHLPSLFHEALAHHALYRISGLRQGLIAVQDLHGQAADGTQQSIHFAPDAVQACKPSRLHQGRRYLAREELPSADVPVPEVGVTAPPRE